MNRLFNIWLTSKLSVHMKQSSLAIGSCEVVTETSIPGAAGNPQPALWRCRYRASTRLDGLGRPRVQTSHTS